MTQQYVCFDQKTGEIVAVGPGIKEDYQYIPVTDEEIEPIKTYKAKMSDYTVAYNRKEKQFVLKKVSLTNEETSFRKLHKIQQDAMYDVLLEIDISKKLCYINTDIELLDTINQTNLDFDKEVTFSFTKKNDPHVLYDMVTFNIGDSSKKSISIKDEYSVFTDTEVADCVYTEVK